MSIENDLGKIPHLSAIGQAIVSFASSLEPGAFTFVSDQWVYRPENFVTMKVQHARAKSLRFSLRGNPHEFEADPVLTLKAGQAGYSTCVLDDPRQLAACLNYIQRAHTVYNRGRTRRQTTPQTVER
jgi:hypothetical protein